MNIDGAWNVKMSTPVGPQDGIIEFKTDGAEFTGKMSAAQGTLELTDGTVDGSNLTWKARMTKPMLMNLMFSATGRRRHDDRHG